MGVGQRFASRFIVRIVRRSGIVDFGAMAFWYSAEKATCIS